MLDLGPISTKKDSSQGSHASQDGNSVGSMTLAEYRTTVRVRETVFLMSGIELEGQSGCGRSIRIGKFSQPVGLVSLLSLLIEPTL